MPTDFYNMMDAGFKEARVQIGNTLTVSNTNYTVIATPIASTQDAETVGYLPMADARADMLRVDFAAASIVDRITVSLDSVAMKVVEIINDPAEPVVSLMLKIDR